VTGAARWLVRRIAAALFALFGATVLSFAIAVALPGDPSRVLVGPQARPADVEVAKRVYGLDGTWYQRLGRHLGRVVHRAPSGARPDDARAHASCSAPLPGVHVDLGTSFVYRKPVAALIWARLPRSLELAAGALLVQLLIGLGAGVLAGAKRGARADDVLMGTALLAASAPTFVVGAGLQHALAYRLHLLPLDGVGKTPGEHLASLILPSIVLGVYGSALLARVTRDQVRAALAADPARTARAKGAGPLRVVIAHGLRNALVPIATLAVLDFGALVGGAVVTEKMFRWPGLGDMAVTAVVNRDAAATAGVALAAAVAVAAASIIVDVLALLLDPRLRASK
jgi:peptide/nickel transport system permease protein